jgi:site-specific DNA-methyltransferase (adenine-specific)
MKEKAPRNQTLTCSPEEMEILSEYITSLPNFPKCSDMANQVICGDTFGLLPRLPQNFVDLLILDPPYNLSKNFNGQIFKEKAQNEYKEWFEKLIQLVKPSLKLNASIYVCSDWKTSIIIAPVLEQHFTIQNRITWEREKGRGSKSNWKNNTEDIWFCSVGNDYFFDVEAVKIKRKVIAPYRVKGKPKDWEEEESGNFRLTHPSNMWTDITIPFWSMPENTDHPTQKPEKLIAKLILASSKKNDFILDPFLGSGTTAVVAKKLERKFLGIEQSNEYCCWSLKRLLLAEKDQNIQGYADGIFWERNSLSEQKQTTKSEKFHNKLNLFECE